MHMRKGWSGTCLLSIGLSCSIALTAGLAAHAQDPPRYKVDPFWPKELAE